MTSHLSTHVLDTTAGRPADGIDVTLATEDGTVLGRGTTDADGRVSDLGPATLAPGVYELTFAVGPYLAERGSAAFFPRATITFTVETGVAHYHVPLLLSPFAYSVYRGS